MEPSFKELMDYCIEVSADQVAHSEKTYLAHKIGVYRDLKS